MARCLGAVVLARRHILKYEVFLIPQTSNMSCWAASIAMILGWKKKMSIPDKEIARNPGGKSYMTSYTKGLDGFAVDEPMCYTPPAVDSLLRHNGPLWVATWAPGPHIRVITGMVGNLLYINDPAPVNRGSAYTRTFRQFFGAMENLGERELKEASPVYLAYLAN